jgi:hypothetical protein
VCKTGKNYTLIKMNNRLTIRKMPAGGNFVPMRDRAFLDKV